MSASDAAPLPRLGEVFFDVRGDSRSMRLSWYADTDVAVFSIWQGGKCTGTFRLPMDDLSRMIEILQRGPEGRSGRRAAERGTGERGARGRGFGERRRDDYGAGDPGPGAGYEADYNGGYESDRTEVHKASGRTSAASAREYGSDDYGADDYGPGDYASGDYRSAERYDDAGRSRSARRPAERYEPGDFGRPDHVQPDYNQDDGWFPDDYHADRTGQRFAPADDSGYGQQGFAPPYGRSRPDSAEPGFMDDSEYGLPADPAVRSRHSAGRHSGGQGR